MSYLQNIWLICLCFLPLHGNAQDNIDTVKMVDSVHIYYFELFNDKRVFDWGTVPKNFNFNNYRIYFKNNSPDTLISGRVTTGDGKVRYGYAGHRKLIHPGEYFVVKPISNTTIQYRMGRFSKGVHMTAMGSDSTYHFYHRFLGYFSNDTVLLPTAPTIKLEEPFNPPLTEEEIKNYYKDLEKIKQLAEYRRYKPRSTFSTKNPKDVRYYIKIYLSREGYDVDDDTKLIYKRYNQQVSLQQVTVEGERNYFVFPNQDSVETAPLEIRLNGRDHGYHKSINAVGRQEIFLDIRDRAPYVVDLVEDKEILLKKNAPIILPSKTTLPPVNFQEKNIQLFMLNGKTRITQNCDAQIFLKTPFPGQKQGWNDLPLKENENGLYFFKQRVYVDEGKKSVRWKIKGDSNWQYDYLILNRLNTHSLVKKTDSTYVIYGHYGQATINWDHRTYRYQIEDRWIKTHTSTYKDSVTHILKWYGIPFLRVDMAQVILVNKTDNMRLQRALNKHFEKAIILPFSKRDQWPCGSGRLSFSEDVSHAHIKKLLTHPSIGATFIREPKKGIIEVTIEFKEMISPQYHALMETLFLDERILKIRTDLCRITPADN